MRPATLAEPTVKSAVISHSPPMETDDALYEFIHGRRVEMPPMSIRAVMIASRIGSAMNAFAKPKRLGEAFTELLIRLPLADDESRDRRPDVSFFLLSSLTCSQSPGS